MSVISESRLTTRYLWLSLLAALIPLVIFSWIYNAYFADLMTRVSEQQMTARVAATQNEMRSFLKERKYELDNLADQMDDARLYRSQAPKVLLEEFENALRLQVDARDVYGVAFFTSQGELSWTFPAALFSLGLSSQTPVTPFEGIELIGPAQSSEYFPNWVILRRPGSSRIGSEQPQGSIGLILRFASLTDTMRHLDQSRIYHPLLKVGGGQAFDTVAQAVVSDVRGDSGVEVIPGWSLHLIQDQGLAALSPTAQMRYWLIILVIGTALCLIWLYQSISRRLNHQVSGLIDSVERIAQGDLDSPIEPASGMEIQRLTLAIDRMRDQLKASIEATIDGERRAALGKLAAGVAHEIRNPLATIKTTVASLARVEQVEAHREMLQMVDEEIDRVNGVIHHLLNYARPSEPHAGKIDVEELLRSVVVLASASARQHAINIVYSCEDNMELWADDSHLRQILLNLLLNAMDAMKGMGGNIHLSAETSSTGQVILTVADQGQGIPQEVLVHILEPFYTTKATGTGLGLAVCAALVKANAGTIRFDSQLGEGTRVHVALPGKSSEEIV